MVQNNDIVVGKKLTSEQIDDLLNVLETRFHQNMHRHDSMEWKLIEERFKKHPEKLWSLHGMKQTGGEPDVVGYDNKDDVYIFNDCVKESPKGRRSVCYDREALEKRKKHKPANSAIDMAKAMGVDMLTEEEYYALQQLETVDTKTSTWVKTPTDIREKGGAIFCDTRYGRVFTYHNGAESYYGSRGFRASLKI